MYAYGTHAMSIQEDLEIYLHSETVYKPIYIMYTHLQVRRIERTIWYNSVTSSVCFGDAFESFALSKRKQTNRRTKWQRTLPRAIPRDLALTLSHWYLKWGVLFIVFGGACHLSHLAPASTEFGGVQDKLAALLLEILKLEIIACKCSTIALLTSHLTYHFSTKLT